MQVTDLVGYNHVVRSLYFDAMAKLPWNEVVADKGLSFDNMRGVFVHLTLVEDRWINYTIPGRFNEWHDPDFEAFKSMEDLGRYMQRVHRDTERYLRVISVEELNRQIAMPWGDKPDTRLPVEACLTHMMLECMIHYGELSAALWQMGQQAPYMGFWRFKHMNP
jgi:uncharacterized damage-inducible protein DinB